VDARATKAVDARVRGSSASPIVGFDDRLPRHSSSTPHASRTRTDTPHTGSHYEQVASPPPQPGASCLIMSSDATQAPTINGNGGGKEGEGGGGGEVDSTEVPTLQLPLLLTATVVKGFGRGSKLLGIPTGK